MSDVELYLWFVVGIVFSVIVPIVAKWLRAAQKKALPSASFLQQVWGIAGPYVKIAVASLIVGFVLLAMYRSGGGKAIEAWYQAFLYGYAWDSTLQKITL